jgi:2-polyprenyl-6-methoxyphenol hydroxylase-like FAD-dependent oxidoreductase
MLTRWLRSRTLLDASGLSSENLSSANLSLASLSPANLSSGNLSSGGLSSEIVIVGAGLAGVTLAAVLGRQGRRVIVVDPRSSCPPLFRAEKIEREQVRLLRKFGLLEHLFPYAARVREVRGAYDGRIFKTSPIEQYGIRHADMVNALRAQTPATVDYRQDRVEHIANSSGVQRVKLSRGEELSCRLVVLACGVSDGLLTNLGLQRRVVQRDQSIGFGFNIAASEARPFDFDALTYYSFSPATRIDYLTLFKFRETMRANLFVFRSANDPWVREFIQEPERMLRRDLPKLSGLIGKYRVTSEVDSGRVDLYKVNEHSLPGVVMIGDAFQNTCPAAGMGLDKVLTDVDVVSECIPGWLASPGMSGNKLADFYEHPRKRETDSEALQRAQDHRRLVVDQSLRWRIHRQLVHLKWQVLSAVWPLRQLRTPALGMAVVQRTIRNQSMKAETVGWQ